MKWPWADYEAFQECVSLSDRPLSEAYDIELALRFLIFSLIEEEELENIGDVGIFITEKMRKIAIDQGFDIAFWENLFEKTFGLLADELAEKAFKRYSVAKSKFSGGFLLSQFEVVAYGLAYNLYKGNQIENIPEKAASIWSDRRYTDWSGSGITATRRLPRILPLGREVFSDGN
ncbi:MAG: hypothetical protein ACFB0G_17655 [Leptolyngbyaceae cyanobacterium]